ncbi:MAG: 4Fe-4S binding protein [Candidatus Lindowbacteria bacterium]|nr:4Fe-4S binding protein [Candidatus Lindowbacteria bacterium]
MTSNDVYIRLREFLDRLPAGYPATDSGVEIKILKKLFSPEDAELVMKLSPEPEDLSTIAQRQGIDESGLKETLDDLARRGLIFRDNQKDKLKYRAFQFVIGIYEFQINNVDREFAELTDEYFPYLGLSFLHIKTKQLRVAPVNSAIQSAPVVAPYNRVRDIVKRQELIAMAPCLCRKKKDVQGNKCDKPHDLCFSFGSFARYYIDNNMGRQISAEEAMELLDLAEKSALVLCPANSQEMEGMCCCCGCCCAQLTRLKLLSNPAAHFQSYYEAVIDPEACTACGACIERCQIDAIEEKGEVMGVNLARCIGCGLCVSTCPAEAITLMEKPGVEAPPKNFEEIFSRIASERALSQESTRLVSQMDREG